MSLPVFTTQAELVSTAGRAADLFGPQDRFRLFALKVYPALARPAPNWKVVTVPTTAGWPANRC